MKETGLRLQKALEYLVSVIKNVQNTTFPIQYPWHRSMCVPTFEAK